MNLEVRLNRTIWEARIAGSAPTAFLDRFIQTLESINDSPEGLEENITITVINDNSILNDKIQLIPVYSSASEDLNKSLSTNWGLYFNKAFNDFNIKPLN